ELEDGNNANAVGTHRLLGLLGRVLGVANLALNLHVRALLEGGRELSELAEDDAAMPFGLRDVLAGLFILIGSLGGDRESGELLVVLAGANFGIVAEEAHEGRFVLVHDRVSVFEFPNCSGHTWAKPCKWARLPSAKPCFLEQGPRLALGEESGKQNGAVPPGVAMAPKQ